AARAVEQPDGALVWEYHFNFGSQRAPWDSGLAQAVLAQAFARAGNLDLARHAFQAIPGTLDRALPAGPWIRLYSQSSEGVLDALLAARRVRSPLPGLRDRPAEAARQADRRRDLAGRRRPLLALRDAGAATHRADRVAHHLPPAERRRARRPRRPLLPLEDLEGRARRRREGCRRVPPARRLAYLPVAAAE